MSIILALLACTGPSDPNALAATVTAVAPEVHVKTIYSKPYTIDKMYPSMRGPYGFDDVRLLDTDHPELLWIVGYKTTVVDAGTEDAMSQEFMCHANLDFEAKDYYSRFPTAPPVSGRVFTLSQGQQEIHFPDGFGIPVTSDLPISLATQVLNLNIEKPKSLKVRHRVDVMFVRDAEVQGQMVPLFQGRRRASRRSARRSTTASTTTRRRSAAGARSARRPSRATPTTTRTGRSSPPTGSCRPVAR
ncbi:MAG: hypothetical protein R3F59_29625 [Myxococcota bacterium]